MGEGLQIASLATFIGKPLAVRYGKVRVTVGAVGRKDGEPFVMAQTKDGTVILGQPSDFSITAKPKRKVK